MNMKHFLLIVVASLSFAGHAQSQSGFWRDSDGKPVAETESMKSENGFAGSLLATTDEDWEKKWNTPPETIPSFKKAVVVPYGKKVFILSFFANPKLDQHGNANVRCDLQVSSPTGKIVLSQKDMVCFSGQLKGSPYNMHLSAPVIAISGDPGDPPGILTIEVLLRDEVRNVKLPLRTSFELKQN